MLGLITHEPHFSLLREEVRFGGKKSSQKRYNHEVASMTVCCLCKILLVLCEISVCRSNTAEETTFHLLHLSVMREYLDFEFSSLKVQNSISKPFMFVKFIYSIALVN